MAANDRLPRDMGNKEYRPATRGHVGDRIPTAGCRLVALLFALMPLGCVSIPVSDELIAYGERGMVKTADSPCAGRPQASSAVSEQRSALDPAGFSLMTWNVYKARAEHWPDDFARLSRGQDVVLLQEAHLTPRFRAALWRVGYSWDMAHAFDIAGAETGVLTASRIPASGACLSRASEPLIQTPKSVLVTKYPFNGSAAELWVANLHGINFTLGTKGFEEQLKSLATLLVPHRGPLIVAGDFNNWSKKRSVILDRVTNQLGLEPVPLAQDGRSRHFGHPVDHVFYRGLEISRAEVLDVSSSDHNPIRTEFRLTEYHRGE